MRVIIITQDEPFYLRSNLNQLFRILPNEVNWLENFVDYFKGCFMGQEQTSRVKYRGRPRRILKTLPNSTQEIVKI